ncbi:DUF3301 domain-containing protein [Pseudothauera rhizosphaerae]|uniref:DUF3301 domain-containing protein n=1 Tax=Pseudothauera rhizosphaerae TaxID=2565932 RepID=A0A4S4AW42_9RHOO|nr:DUF3301 domain-containing protein [Pseudothauera rhizosphaerae]THF63445.1 DUF3301 domain-containing protein [Pseudothauera rhizosphaerae]
MTGFELSALVLLAALAWFWLDSLKAREAGMAEARAACRREGVQLLDETVACRSLRLARDDDGHAALRRVYEFEYSGSGDDRYHGAVVLLGREVVMLDVGEHRRAGQPLH